MDEGKEYKENIGLIYLAIKKEHIFYKTQDDFQDFMDAGTDGLLKGIRTYDISKGIKKSTYYYKCIKYELLHMIIKKNAIKRTIKTVSLNMPITKDSELVDLIPSTMDLETEMIIKEKNEKLLEYVNKLPRDKYKETIKYIYGLDGYEKLSARELAKRWNVYPNAVNEIKTRALRILWLIIRRNNEL